jgi:hypothetical protein
LSMDGSKGPRYARRARNDGALQGRCHRMPMFQSQARTAESYVAGLGASGALMASAIIVFVVLIGVVTFNAWPNGGLFGGGNDVIVDAANVSSQDQGPGELSLAELLGGPVQPGGTLVAARPVSGSGGGAGGGGSGGGGTGGSGGSGGSTGGGGTTTQQQDPGGSPSQLQQTVDNGGNRVQDTTSNLGGAVDSTTGTNLGSSLLDPVGSTVNDTLKGLGSGL